MVGSLWKVKRKKEGCSNFNIQLIDKGYREVNIIKIIII
jgi:hypothetical protein